ncbi:MAG: DUF4388 domain-containing protein [Acidimicrobiales bacterium]|nr:DUF4388 domain-containing protein [Acidimicrobiales bacterium]
MTESLLHVDLGHVASREALMLLGSTSVTGVIEASNDGRTARIELVRGRVVDAHWTADASVDATSVIAAVMNWSEGSLTVTDDVPASAGRGLPLEQALADADRRLKRGIVGAVGADLDTPLVMATELEERRVLLSAEAWSVLAALGAGSTGREVAARLGHSELAMSDLLAELAEQRMVSEGSAASIDSASTSTSALLEIELPELGPEVDAPADDLSADFGAADFGGSDFGGSDFGGTDFGGELIAMPTFDEPTDDTTDDQTDSATDDAVVEATLADAFSLDQQTQFTEVEEEPDFAGTEDEPVAVDLETAPEETASDDSVLGEGPLGQERVDEEPADEEPVDESDEAVAASVDEEAALDEDMAVDEEVAAEEALASPMIAPPSEEPVDGRSALFQFLGSVEQ